MPRRRAALRIALCYEVIAPMPFPEQCAYAARLGYDGLEVAPYTLPEERQRLGVAQIGAARRAAEDAGIAVTGLHWLLLKPLGLSISARDRLSARHTGGAGGQVSVTRTSRKAGRQLHEPRLEP
jgi:sugar phosphate isomerase/epimerase